MKDKWNNSRKYGRRHNRFDVKLTDEELAVVKKKLNLRKCLWEDFFGLWRSRENSNIST